MFRVTLGALLVSLAIVHMSAGFVVLPTEMALPVPTAESSSAQFDFYAFSQDWPATECLAAGVSCADVPSFFTIHGLWPDRVDGGYPAFCNKKTPYEASAIADLRSDMDVLWNPIYGEADSFWGHEWDKHGTCAVANGEFADEHAFFSAVLALRKKIDLVDALKSGGVVPSNQNVYTLDELNKAVESQLGTTPVFLCESRDGKVLLDEVWMCVSKELEVIPCADEWYDHWVHRDNMCHKDMMITLPEAPMKAQQ